MSVCGCGCLFVSLARTRNRADWRHLVKELRKLFVIFRIFLGKFFSFFLGGGAVNMLVSKEYHFDLSISTVHSGGVREANQQKNLFLFRQLPKEGGGVLWQIQTF